MGLEINQLTRRDRDDGARAVIENDRLSSGQKLRFAAFVLILFVVASRSCWAGRRISSPC